MKICVTGSQNMGKSTLIADIIDKYPKYSTPTESYRDVIVDNNLNLNQNADIKGQTIILNKLITELLTNKQKNVILDRSILDNLIYTTWAYQHDTSDISHDYIYKTSKYALQFFDYYDYMIYIPLLNDGNDPVIVDDGLRDVSPNYRNEIGELFDEAIKYIIENNIFDENKLITVSGSREERMDMFSDFFDTCV